jgi:hypothetical protein
VATGLAGAFPVRSVVNVDQPLKIDDLQDRLKAAAPALRGKSSFPAVMSGLFDQLAGHALPAEERTCRLCV